VKRQVKSMKACRYRIAHATLQNVRVAIRLSNSLPIMKPGRVVFKIAQTAADRSRQTGPMSIGDWYQYKAVQCTRLAKDASDPVGRARYEEEEKAWRQLADQIEAHETVRFGPGFLQ